MDRHILFGFTNVDQTADPDYFIRFLDTASSQESFQNYKRRSFSLLEIKSGQHILELGGGTGDDARALAALVGPQGRVDCVDNSTDGFRNGWLGRYIPALFEEAGLLDVRAHPETLRLTYPLICQVAGQATVERARAAQVISAAEGETWLRFLDLASERGRLFSTITGFLVVGRKPGTSGK